MLLLTNKGLLNSASSPATQTTFLYSHITCSYSLCVKRTRKKMRNAKTSLRKGTCTVLQSAMVQQHLFNLCLPKTQPSPSPGSQAILFRVQIWNSPQSETCGQESESGIGGPRVRCGVDTSERKKGFQQLRRARSCNCSKEHAGDGTYWSMPVS